MNPKATAVQQEPARGLDVNLLASVAVALAAELRRADGHERARLPADGWAAFSCTEQRVVCLLLAHPALSREEIAVKLDESVDGRLKGILATLVGRHVLLVTSDGYAVNAPLNRRRELLRWMQDVFDLPGAEERPARRDAGEAEDEGGGPLTDDAIALRIEAARAARLELNGYR